MRLVRFYDALNSCNRSLYKNMYLVHSLHGVV